MTAVRLAQGVVFGLVLGTGASEAEGPDRPGAIVSTLLLVVGVLFLVSALRKLLDEPDEDAPPPRWMLMISTATPRQAFAFGAGVVAASAKLWAFTLGAIAVIAEADLGRADALALFLVFVVLAESVHISLVAFAYASPRRAGPTLDRVTELLAPLQPAADDRPRRRVRGLVPRQGAGRVRRHLGGRDTPPATIGRPVIPRGPSTVAYQRSSSCDHPQRRSRRRRARRGRPRHHRLAVQAPRVHLPVVRDLRRHQRRVGLRAPRGRAQEQREARLVARDGPGPRRHRRPRRRDPDAPPGVGDERPRRLVQRSARRVRELPPPLPARRAARRREPERHRPARPRHRRAPRARSAPTTAARCRRPASST